MDETVSLDGALDLISKKYLELKSESRDALKKCAKIEVFEKNTILIKENQYSDGLMFIITGALRATIGKMEKISVTGLLLRLILSVR
ncbi:hypothetical protein [Pedobacter cryoconitis]|uniref:Signal-transduction protein with cAMP-binding, CBS, and nucleotidyltransferase domain n=1 Tax=Pedobacter cryoconitis TaxID=188932 RepID=A0A7X0J3S1_9SPHI|nr:hypothetical protein [Pedobacter cryoconitis]MBB6499867.1 signal-transduction protein with cAMP-binding, CBS, and nucleotidyltransferase domain [Pedobacter cryoconitis]